MKALQVIKPGLFTTIQDAGRYGYLRQGVPVSGAMDVSSLVAANVLVGNNMKDGCIETTLLGPELEALAETNIAITGGNCSPEINGLKVPMWKTLKVQKGDLLSFEKIKSGCRTYISIRGGVKVPLVLGSRSTFVRGGFGGMKGRQLKMGDTIEGFDRKPLDAQYAIPEEVIPHFGNRVETHVILGPQADMFSKEGVNTFLSEDYEVTLEADRMGYRLEGPPIEHKADADIVSDALLPGAVQVPKDGRPILLMRDAQTTGGYPKIAVVITSDQPMLGQLRPMGTVRFLETTVKEAQRRLKEHSRLLEDLSSKLVRAK